MPHKPKKPCAFPGCPALTDKRFCDEHSRAEARRYNRYSRDPDSAKRYGGSWRKISAAFLRVNPLCELCKADGRFTAAVLVHHKVKLMDGGTHDVGNLQVLCASCHSRLHAKQGDCF